jgi:hypothetical protein
VAKSRSRSARKRPTSASKPKSNSKPARRPQKKKKKNGKRGAGIVSLKPLYDEIGLKILELQQIESGDERVKLAIKELEDCRLEFSRLCLPSMDFPIRALSTTPS